MPRTTGTVAERATSWPAALLLPSALPGLSVALAARATKLAVERFYTTVEQIRERATEEWRRTTLTKEKRPQMFLCPAAPPPLPAVPQRGVAGCRHDAVFCQSGPARLPRSFTFDWCGRLAFPSGLRRFQD